MNRRIAIKSLAAAGLLLDLKVFAASTQHVCSFSELLLPATVNGGFALADYWVWCGSVIKGDDNQYHMFASRWPRNLAFSPHWLTNSEIVRAVSDKPEGPYVFAEVVFPARGAQYWDGLMTHNPTIHRYKNRYLLFYTGTTFDGEVPTPATPVKPNSPTMLQARANQRIGLATAPSPAGPWTRMAHPVLEPRPGKWDALMTTNAAPCVREDGSIMLIYKSMSSQQDLLRMGIARASRFDAPFTRLSEEPIFNFDKTNDHVEDGYLWWQHGKYNLLMKDMNGGLGGEKFAGVHATAADGIHWVLSQPAKAYSRKIKWSDGQTSIQGHLERPQLLIQKGVPTHLFFATGDGPGGFNNMTRTWNMVIPLKKSC